MAKFTEIFDFLHAPREISGQDRNLPGLKNYRAEYRMNTGYWKMERTFRALDDTEARRLAKEALPKRKKNDKTYMLVHKVWCTDPDTDEEQS